MAGVNVSESAMLLFSKNTSKKFLSDGNQLRPVLGKKWKTTTKEAKTIKFFITTEIQSMEKPAVGSLITQSKGGKIQSVTVTPKTYITTSIMDEIEYDSTGLNLSKELEEIHARSMGIRLDELILETIANATYKASNTFADIHLSLYEDDSTNKGIVNIVEKTAGIGGSKTKYLIVDSTAHAKLLKNEKFISNDYREKGVVSTGSMHGAKVLGLQVLLLEDLDEEFHGVNSLIEKVTGSKDVCYIVTEESLCAGAHRDGFSTTISKEALINNDYVIQTNMSLACQVLTNRAMYKVNYK